MGSNERILRLKENTRRNILDKALCIMTSEGCDALSMRKLADQIAFTPPVIYGYFKSKEDIYQELTRRGHLMLTARIEQARNSRKDPESQITAMWVAYWDFAFEHPIFYRLMYRINVTCCTGNDKIPEAGLLSELMLPVIASLYGHKAVTDKEVQIKFFTYWCVIHGLIALDMISRSAGDAINQQILHGAIEEISHSIREEVIANRIE